MILTAISVELARIARTLMPYCFSNAALTGRTSWLMIWVEYQVTSPSFFAASISAASAAWTVPPARPTAAAATIARRSQRADTIEFLPMSAARPPRNRADPSRRLAISILELHQSGFSTGASRHRRTFSAHQTSPRRLSRRMRMARLSVNGQSHTVDVDPNTPLLWVLRENVGLTGTKYGCGIAQCGACTVHVDGVAMRSCSVPVSVVEGKQITTIEGLAQNGTLHKVQKAWLEHDVPQCGYCQSGMIMAVAALLKEKPKPSDADIDANISNICRCGTYQQVRAAIHAAAGA